MLVNGEVTYGAGVLTGRLPGRFSPTEKQRELTLGPQHLGEVARRL